MTRASHSLPLTGIRFRVQWFSLFFLAGSLLLTSCSTYNPVALFRQELSVGPSGGSVIDDVPDIDRRGRKDGFAALNTLVRFWDKDPVEQRGASGFLNVDADVALVDDVVQDQLVERDLWSFAFYGSMRVLKERLEQQLPLLVIVQDNPRNIETRRYMVLVGINDDTQKILAQEGGPYPGVYSYEHFLKIWRPVKNWVMIVCPPSEVKWDLRMLEHVALARYREKRGNWEEAVEDYDRAIRLDPYNVSLKLAKGDALFQLGDDLAALSLYRSVLNSDDLNARAANNLAYVLADSNANMSEAERLVRRALTIEPSNPLYLDTLGYILLKAGRQREAAQVLSQAHRRMDTMTVLEQRKIVERLVLAFNQSNQPHLARQLLQEYQEKDPEYQYSQDLEESVDD